MPYKRPFSNPKTGESWPQAFWYAAALLIDYLNLTLSLLYRGHVSAQTLNKEPVPAMEERFTTTPEETAELLRQLAAYQLTPEEWAGIVDVPNRRLNVTVLMAMICDKTVLSIKDRDSGEVDGQGNKIMISFFEGLTPLPPDLSVLK